jgi:hypothetical protein
MAAVDFPASPVVGQIFSPGGGVSQYIWTGVVWNAVGVSPPKTWVSTTPPGSPMDGDFWWQSDTGILYFRYNDGNSTQWVVATPAMDLAATDTRYVLKAGDKMTGALQVFGGAGLTAPFPSSMSSSYVTAANGLGRNAYVSFDGTQWLHAITGHARTEVHDQTTGIQTWGYSPSKAAGVAAVLTQHMQLDTAGNLQVTGDVRAANDVNFRMNAGAAGIRNVYFNATNWLQFDPAFGWHISMNGGGGMDIDGAANLKIYGAVGTKASGTTWANPSDARIKTDVADYPQGLDAIVGLRPVSFRFRDEAKQPPGLHVGLVAQEAEKVMPGIVTTAKGEIGDLKFDDFKSLDASNIIFALVNACRELKEQNEALAARVAALEAP